MTLRLVSLTAVIGACLAFLATAAAGSEPSPVVGVQQSASVLADGPRVHVLSALRTVYRSVVSPEAALQVPPGTSVVPGRVLVRFRPGVALSARSDAVSSVKASVATAYTLVPRLELLRLPAGTSVAGAVAALSRDSRVQYAVPDLAVKLATTPNDPLYSGQWAPQAIGAPAAWGRTTGSAGVTVAVLDTGAYLTHPDLAGNLVPGWNFVNNTNNPSDDYGHGTHVSGIIGAVGNNGVGVAGINWHVSLMPLKICDSNGSCNLDAEVSALQYAVAHGAKIANASFGGFYGGYQPEEDAIAAAGQSGLLFVAAAGNATNNNDAQPFYPASYPLSNIISVAATTSSGDLASFSDYGFNRVSIGAPGQDILSTMLTSGPLSDPSGYGNLSGTSMAAPEVSGAAALLWAEHPSWTMQQVRMRLLTTASPLTSLGGEVADCSQLNVAAATDPTVPDESIVCVGLSGTGAGSVSSDSLAINCGTTCAETVPAGTAVTLSATPASGSTFVGWSGACSGTGQCSVNATGIEDVTAKFRTSGSPPGWQQKRLPVPGGRDPFPPGAGAGSVGDWQAFYNVAVSADGSERAEVVSTPQPRGTCLAAPASSDPGGVFLEHRTAAGWVADGEVTTPSVPGYPNDPDAKWANCWDFGVTTQLSADGTTLLVAPNMGPVFNDPNGIHYRCEAFVYRHVGSNWTQAATLYPPGGVGPRGSSDPMACGYFGQEGAISADGSRVAMLVDGADGSGQPTIVVDIYVQSAGAWSLEQTITLPTLNADCAYAIGPRQMALSGDGTTLLVGDAMCDDGGVWESGVVEAYARSGSQWTLAQTIHSPQPAQKELFGMETALSNDGNTAVIGSNNTFGHSTWVFERGAGGWQMSALLPQPNIAFFCGPVVQDGARILCDGRQDDVGFNREQGAAYIFDRPAGGWASAQPVAQEAFASDGFSADWLGQANPLGWPTIAAPEDGSFMDVPISSNGIISGLYPHDRIGYEFTTGQIDQTLTVATTGGSGAVSSNPSGISCGSICSHDYAPGTSVTLTATPTGASTFSGWTGDCSGTGTCTLAMSADHSATAVFNPGAKLTVSRSGTGSGTVSSSPAGISCGSTCAAFFVPGATVQLTATPALGSSFDGWSGACSGTGSCSVSMTQARSVSATFTAHPPVKLTVSKLGPAAGGKIVASPAGINCGAYCFHLYPYGTSVTLHALPASGYLFGGWSGDCAGAGATCILKMTAAHTTSALFGVPRVLTAVKLGTGAGVVKSTPGGISCPSTCKHSFAAGSTVTLTATAKSGSKFTGWSGACSGTGSCLVKMSAAKKVKATFAHTGAPRRTGYANTRRFLATLLRLIAWPTFLG